VIKLVSLMYRKPGMSMADFRAYYEERHAPLIGRLLLPFMTDYRRNYAVEGPLHRSRHMAEDRPVERAFDVLTETTFASREMYQRMLDALADPEIGRVIAADEANLFDRSTMRSYLVEECRSA
jgi:EthD domain